MPQTTNYNLPTFGQNDVPTWLGSWNDAMIKIDAAIKEASESGGELPTEPTFVAVKIKSVSTSSRSPARLITSLNGSLYISSAQDIILQAVDSSPHGCVIVDTIPSATALYLRNSMTNTMGLSFELSAIRGLANPTNPSDASNKAYVDLIPSLIRTTFKIGYNNAQTFANATASYLNDKAKNIILFSFAPSFTTYTVEKVEVDNIAYFSLGVIKGNPFNLTNSNDSVIRFGYNAGRIISNNLQKKNNSVYAMYDGTRTIIFVDGANNWDASFEVDVNRVMMGFLGSLRRPTFTIFPSE